MKHDMHFRTPFWKLALGGVIAGAALYFFPFLIPALAFVLIAGLLFRMFFGFGRYAHMRHAYAMHWQNMSEDERKAARERFHGYGPGYGCGHWYAEKPAQQRTTPNA
jgi:hypothetical protein